PEDRRPDERRGRGGWCGPLAFCDGFRPGPLAWRCRARQNAPMRMLPILLPAAALALAVPGAAREAALPASPAERFGDLFAAAQMARIFPDGKSFADAVARRPDAAILADWRRQRPSGEALRAF